MQQVKNDSSDLITMMQIKSGLTRNNGGPRHLNEMCRNSQPIILQTVLFFKNECEIEIFQDKQNFLLGDLPCNKY